MNIRELQKNWNELGIIDPLWAILSYPDKKGGKWNAEEFFKSGVREISEVMDYLKKINITYTNRKALDFGCGVGRLTQALAPYFDEIYGIDISPSMIKLAKNFNRYPGTCQYILNECDHLRILPDNSIDFIYTNIVFQHIEPIYTKRYIKEFLRIMAPGALATFQLITKQIGNIHHKTAFAKFRSFFKKVTPNFLLRLYRRVSNQPECGGGVCGQPIIEMHCISESEMVDLIRNCGGKVLDIVHNDAAGPDFDSIRCCMTKNTVTEKF
ncbi:MAG: class I SAM-dependent methyltransferase [Candidatus Omnitrophota bacterium]